MSVRQHSFSAQITQLVSPQLLRSIFTLGVPWPKTTPPTVNEWNTPRHDDAEYERLCWDPLVALSKIPFSVASTLDFLTLLPEPHDPDFPVQALGLLIFLDQAPRYLCNNTNERWRNGFFDELALAYSLQLRKLPEDTRIHEFTRWKDIGFSFEHYCAISNYLTAPFAHSEDLTIHERYLLTEDHAHRAQAEKYFNTTDTIYADEIATGTTLDASTDTTAFARLIRERVPPTADFAQTVFWRCRVKEAHVPIIRTFGRYPYRNRALGRDTTKKEEEFLRETGNFGVSVDDAAARRIRGDVERGVWTPLCRE